MAAHVPFLVVTASASGKTLIITPGQPGTSQAGTLSGSGGYIGTIMAVNPGTTTAWVRMSTETAPVATVNDIPLPAGSVRLFANPNPTGVTGFGVICTVTTTLANIYFVPGQGGI